MVVHFPIVFILTLAALDAVATLRGFSPVGRSGLGNVSAGLAVLAGVTAIAAFVLGDAALEIAEAGGWHHQIAEIHEGLGTTSAIILGFWAVFRAILWVRDVTIPGWLKGLVPLAEIGMSGLILATAYYGGQLVYELGVNVHVVQ
jgi:uncharacterized membrane protein